MPISAVVWRKVLLVLFMIFELGPYLESLWNGLSSESIGCGIKAFFHPKNWLWSLGQKKGEKSLWCCALYCTKRTFLQTRNEPHLLKSTPSGPFSRPKIKHLWDFSLFLGPRLQSQFLGWKNAFTPHLIDSDGRTIHKGSENGPNSKIMKNTKSTFLQTTAEIWILSLLIIFNNFFANLLEVELLSS